LLDSGVILFHGLLLRSLVFRLFRSFKFRDSARCPVLGTARARSLAGLASTIRRFPKHLASQLILRLGLFPGAEATGY
jgi:hypothetical protein